MMWLGMRWAIAVKGWKAGSGVERRKAQRCMARGIENGIKDSWSRIMPGKTVSHANIRHYVGSAT